MNGNSNMEKQVEVRSGLKDVRTREKWSKQLDFTVSCIGYAVGLGAFWRFPYLCMRNGGGAFLIPYFLFLFLCGLPLFFLELVIGQFSGLSPINIWNICPLFKGIGWSMVIMSGIVTIYYNLIIAWVLYFLVSSLTSNLPWASCNNTWNTPSCIIRSANTTRQAAILDFEFLDNSTEFLNTTALPTVIKKQMTAAEEFWQYDVLELSSGIDSLGKVRWQLLLCLFFAWVLVFLCISRGIRSSGKVVYVTATAPYVFLTLLLIRGLLLPGAIDGILFYLTPDFNHLLSLNVWAEACLQIFYSLGPAWGGLITMSSYNNFNNNCLRLRLMLNVYMVCLSSYSLLVLKVFLMSSLNPFSSNMLLSVNTLLDVKLLLRASLWGGLMADLGTHEGNMDSCACQGPGMAFTAYPEAITKLPISPMWAIFFFLMLLTLGLDSQFGMLETCTSGFIDEFPRLLGGRRLLFTAFVCLVQFTIGIPLVTQGGMYLFQILDWYAAAFSAMFIAFLECIVISHIYKVDRVYEDMTLMFGRRPSVWWRICWCYITPLIMLVMLVYSCVNMIPPKYGTYEYPTWAIVFGWMVAMCSLVPMPIVAMYRIIYTKGRLIEPTPLWGPNSPEHQRAYRCRSAPPTMPASAVSLVTEL